MKNGPPPDRVHNQYRPTSPPPPPPKWIRPEKPNEIKKERDDSGFWGGLFLGWLIL